MFGLKKKPAPPPFDPAGKTPVVRASICTGEKVAGWQDGESGRFTEIMLIRDEKDLREFLAAYGFDAAQVKYEW